MKTFNDIAMDAKDTVSEYSKVGELRTAIGTEFSDNYSPTLRSRLLEVSECGNTCTVISVNAYGKEGGAIRKEPSYLTWNAIFY
jgi:hypothetical protein